LQNQGKDILNIVFRNRTKVGLYRPSATYVTI